MEIVQLLVSRVATCVRGIDRFIASSIISVVSLVDVLIAIFVNEDRLGAFLKLEMLN